MVVKQRRISLPEPFGIWALRILSHPGFDLAPLDVQTITEAAGLSFHNDPFDAVIVASARVKDLPLITRDRAITEARVVDIVW